ALENLRSINAIVNTMPNPVFFKDDEFRYCFFNQAFEDFVGVRKEILIGNIAADIADRENCSEYERSDRIIVETKKFYSYESKIKHADGTMRDAVFYKSPIFSADGAFRGIVGVILDISERKKMEEALSLFKHVVEQSPTSIVMTDRAGVIEYINPHFTALTGYSQDEAVGKNPRILKSGLMNQYVYSDLWQKISSGGEWRGELLNRKKDGSLYWEYTSISSIRNAEGEISHYIGVKEDISERKMMESALKDSEVSLKALLNAITDPLVLIGSDGTVVALNDAVAAEIGIPAGDIIGKNGEHLIPGGSRPDQLVAIEEVFRTGRPLRREDEIGGRIYDTFLYPVRREGGAVHRVAVYHKDITEHRKNADLLRKLVEKAERARDDAEKANRQKSNFLSAMSHEIRTPLNAIIGMTDLSLLTDSDLEKLNYLHTVKDSALHLLSVINDVLDFSKLESGKFVISRSAVDIRKETAAALAIFTNDAKAKGVSLVMNIDSSVPPLVTGDGAAFRQILINLAGNAVKFTEKGSVTADIRAEEDSDGKSILIKGSVTDTGIGIPEERMPLIFESFTRAQAYTGSRYGGSGLGLSISRNLAELMGGTITASSTMGQGSVFYLRIPFLRFTGESVPEKTAVAHLPHNLSILVAEDNLINVKFISIVMRKLGHTLSVAEDGRKALSMLSEHDYDLVLMDIEMPEMDGFEVTTRLRAGEAGRNQNIPVLALTAHAVAEIQDRCQDAGMDGYITKP
ncbi:MAG: PAS domain S-box protein, partial [Spirochaetota bacterium]